MEQFYTCGGVRVAFRPMRPGEDGEIRACLRDEYGDSYDNKAYYQDGYFTEQVRSGRMEVYLIVTDTGETAGFYITKWDTWFPGQPELSTLVIRRAYRGSHITGPLFDDWLARMDRTACSAYFGHMQVFHTRIASEFHAHGLHLCGYLLSVLISDKLHHSFGENKTPKLPFAIGLKAVKTRDAGLLHLPKRYHDFARQVYDSLGASCRLTDESTEPAFPSAPLRAYSYEGQDTLWIFADAVGADLVERVRGALAASDAPLLTANVLINAKDPAAPWACEALRPLGFFTGLQPLAKDADYVIFHIPRTVPVLFDDYADFPPWTPLLERVEAEYAAWKEGDAR